MHRLSESSCAKYRDIVFNDPEFIEYFRSATPDYELKVFPDPISSTLSPGAQGVV
jgi:phosphoenolpyruvate carboxylase